MERSACHGAKVTKVTPQESIEMRCVPITTTTKDTAIAYQLQRVITVCRNQIAPLLDKLLNRDGMIPTDKTVPLIREELRQAYFDKFHLMDLYVYFHSSKDPQRRLCHPYFLKSAEEIQKSVFKGAVSSWDQIRQRNTDELHHHLHSQ